MIDGGVYSKGNEKLVLQVRDALIIRFLLQGKNVIVDDTNLHPKHEEDIRLLVEGYNRTNNDNVTVEVKVFDVSVEECIERDKKRFASVGAEIILRMARQWCPDKYGDPVPELDPHMLATHALPWCVIYDLDGTAAIMGDRSPYDASKCDEVDRPNYALRNVLWGMADTDIYTFIAMSGRDEQYRGSTENFLRMHNFPYSKLYMRKTGDTRKDAIIKKELFEEHIQGKYNVLVTFDDRNQMVDMWRKELGIPCFQVNYGDF